MPLKPVTKDEKLQFTLEFQIKKAIEELLADLYYEEKYEGLVDIWTESKIKNNQLAFEVRSKKIDGNHVELTNSSTITFRYHCAQGKGIKRII